ncbi:MAG: hypothetical protein V4645_30655 [Pseudomonadota bacterium]
MTDEANQKPTEDPKPRAPARGIFLPSMNWTEDKSEVEREKRRLLALQEKLSQVMTLATEADECATWWLMANASLDQLDRDLDDLFDWLEQSERGTQGEDPLKFSVVL